MVEGLGCALSWHSRHCCTLRRLCCTANLCPPLLLPLQALLMAVELYAAAAIIWESTHTFMPPLIGGSESMTDPVRTPWQGLFGSAASGGPLTASAPAADAAARQLEL